MPYIFIKVADKIIIEKEISEEDLPEFLKNAHNLEILAIYKPEDISLCVTNYFGIEKKRKEEKHVPSHHRSGSGHFLFMECPKGFHFVL